MNADDFLGCGFGIVLVAAAIPAILILAGYLG